MRKGLLVVISGASGTGKGTVCSALLAAIPDLGYSISATTRPPREGEADGVNYYFLERAEFERRITAGDFLEYANVYGNYYGTPLGKIRERREAGQDVLLEIDTQGALNVMKKCPDGVFIFLLPPSMKDLRTRICGRGSESEETLCRRLGAAKEEIEIGKKYQYVVVNDDVACAVEKIEAILTAEHCRMEKDEQIDEVLKDESK